MKASAFKSLMLGMGLCALAGSAFAYTDSSGTTTVTTGAPTANTQVYSSQDYQTGAAPQYPSQNMGGLQNTPTQPRKIASASQSTMAPNGAAVTNPQQISACLCMEQSYQSLEGQVSEKQSAYDQAVAQRASLDNQLASERAKGTSDVNIIRTQSEQRIALQGQINDVYIPQLQAAVSQYNSAVGQYKQSCAGKMFDANVEAQVQSTLQCRG